MARPLKNNADYFSHDAGMRHDEKIKAVRRKFKHEGYSVWNMLLEKLCFSENFTTEYNDVSIELMAGDFDIDEVRLNEIIEYFLKLGLLKNENGKIFSETMITRFEPLFRKRKHERSELSTSITQKYDIIEPVNTHSKVKETIAYKSTGNEIKVNQSKSREVEDLPF